MVVDIWEPRTTIEAIAPAVSEEPAIVPVEEMAPEMATAEPLPCRKSKLRQQQFPKAPWKSPSLNHPSARLLVPRKSKSPWRTPLQNQPPVPTMVSEELIERIANRVVEKLSREVIERIAWEVVPDLAELMIKEHVDAQLKESQPR